ncbi:MAG: hypothetical protein RL557_539 [archaeon]
MPLSLRVIFVVLVLGVISSLWFIPSISLAGYPLVAWTLYGNAALVSFFIFNIILTIVIFVGMWNRAAWTWELGILYFAFFILTNAWTFFDIVRSSLPLVGVYIYSMILNGISVIINVVFLIIMYRQRFYFEPHLRR